MSTTWDDALFNRLGATELDRSICGPQGFAVTFGAGFQWSNSENLPDVKTIVVWGMDPVSTSIHTWELIRRARKHNNARLVVIDPYRSRTSAYADTHLRPHPGTDGALALAAGHVVLRDGLADDEFIADHTTDIDAYRAAVDDWTPERAALETGLSVDWIVQPRRDIPA